ncbi:MAG TPA: RHS repeat-associated core domain-containing protein [Candidatus Limnocylindria bacterium]
MFGAAVFVYVFVLAAISIGIVLKPLGASRHWRPAKLRVRVLVGFALFLVLLPIVAPAFPSAPLPWLFPGIAQAAETVNSPQYIAPAIMPNGQVGMVFKNDAGAGVVEIRFKRYFVEWGMDPSVQLSTATPNYPQLASFQGKTIAAYVDDRGGPNQFRLLFRVSTDNGATWGSEYAPFGAETFDSGNSAPLLITSRDGSTLYFFHCCVSSLPQYRSTTDPALVTWTSSAPAGDASIRPVSNNNCGNAAAECYRAHTFEFTETATAGQWVYITKSDSGWGQSGRGTQVGTLGGAWSAQVDHGGSGGLSGGGESRATAFLDRGGNVIYVRAGERGDYLYYKKSTDGGFTWGPGISAYTNALDIYTVGSPVGLYDPNYTRGEYVWYAGFGGVGAGNSQNAVRVIPLWPGAAPYQETGSVRLFGSLGGDYDFGAAYPYTFGRRDIPTGIGAYKTSAEDLAIPGRLLNLSFTRAYSSADTEIGLMGPAWTHSFNWALTDAGSFVQVRRGDGRRDSFTKNPDTSYAPPPNVFDVLTKNGDSTFTLTLKNQTQYEFSTAGKLTRIHEPAGNQILLNYINGKLGSVTDTVGRLTTLNYSSGHNLAMGKTYTESVAPHPNYPDNNNSELTDGTIASGTSFYDSGWQGHLGIGSLDVTIDLGSSQSLDLFRSYYYDDPGSGIYRPASVEILTSPDNLSYTTRGTTLAAGALNDSGRLWRYDLAVSPVSARYVRFRVTAGGTWLFSSEMSTYLAGADPIAAAAGTNSGQTKTYVTSVAASASFPDTGGTELTDGNLGNPDSYTADASWQGHQNLGATPLDVTVDLGAAQRVGVVRSYHFNCPGCGVFRPAKIEMLTSTDNSLYTSRGYTVADAAVNDAGSRWRYEFDLSGVSARWVRFRITTGGEWLFSSEVQVFAEGAGPITLPLSYSDRLTSVVDPSTPGRKVSYGYDQTGRLTRFVDKIGNTAGQDPVLHSWHYAYDGPSQHITTVVDPDSRFRVTNTYNTEGRLATQKDGVGNTSSFTYGNQITMVTDPRGHLTTQLFDPRWRLNSQSEVVNLENYLLQYFYEDAWENLTRTIDRNGNETIFEYDARGNVITKTDPPVPPDPATVTHYEYDTKNNLTRILDARGFETINTYNSVTNVKESTKQQIATGPATYALTKWQYLDGANPGLPTKIISPRGNTDPLNPNYTYSQTVVYDGQGNLSTRTDADGNLTRFCYDSVSRQTSMIDPDGSAACGVSSPHTWITTYDPNDRVTENKDPLTHSAFTGYDGAGNRTSATDRNGNITTYAYDGAARLLNVKQKPDPVAQPSLVYTTTVTQRDANSNATQVTQDQQGAGGANTIVTDYGYDEIDRLTSATTHPTAVLNLTTSYVFDHNGNTTRRTTADTVQTNYQYDALNRLKQVSATGLSTITYSYDELSHRKQMIDGTGTSTYTYDGLGRLKTANQPNGNLAYDYDLDSNRTLLTYPTVGSVTYAFGPAGRLSTVTDWASRASSYTYYPSGLAHTVTLPSSLGGLTTTYGYDNAQRLTSLENATAGGTITSDTYTLDSEGNRTAIDELMPPVVFASAKINTDAGTAVQDHPAIAVGSEQPNPASYLIWDDQRDGATNSNIYFSRRDPVTGVWSANVKVNTDTGTRNQANPAIATDSSSNAYAVWDDFRDGTNNQNIYYSKRSAGTGTWSTPNLKVNDGTGNTNERNPRIAGTAAGIETAVWVDLRSSQNNIYSSQLPAGGSAWPANKKITDNTAALKDFPDVAVDSANTAYAVWQDSRNGNVDVFFSSLTNGGANWAANVKISDDPGTAAQTKPRIGVDSTGNLTAAWIDARTSPAHVRVARKPVAGAWSASIDITPTPANVQSLALSVRPDGFAWAVWGDTRAGASNQDIWGSRYDPSLNTWSAPVRLDDDPGTSANQLNPTVAFGPAEVMLSWRDNRLSANGDTQARRIQVIAGMADHFALSYDGLNRLKGVVGPVAESFALDGPSNVTSRSGTTESYDKSNRLTDDGSTHNVWSDADRLTTRGTDTFGYDALDRMTSSNVSGSPRTYAYNGDGLLQSRTGSGATTFLWEPLTSPSRLLRQGSDNIVYGFGALYIVKSDGTTLTLARDASKNVRAELNGGGSVTAAFRYRSYGQVSQSTTASPTYLGMASQLIDPSGLYYMRARWYDASVGRFLTHDAVRGSADSPASLNGYNYANANPGLLSDPSGLAATAGDDAGCGDLCPGDDTSPWQLGWEWLTGTGPREHNFTDGDAFTELLRGSDYIQQLTKAVGSGALPDSGPVVYSLGGIDGAAKYARDYSTVVTGGRTGNLAVTYLGSYTGSYSVTNGILEIRISNESTIASATHPPVIGYTDWWQDAIGNPLNQAFASGPMSKTSQQIVLHQLLHR